MTQNKKGHSGYSLMGKIIEDLGRQENDADAVQSGRDMQEHSKVPTQKLSPKKRSESREDQANVFQSEPEVTPELLATLPKGTKVKSVTLPSDRKK